MQAHRLLPLEIVAPDNGDSGMRVLLRPERGIVNQTLCFRLFYNDLVLLSFLVEFRFVLVGIISDSFLCNTSFILD